MKRSEKVNDGFFEKENVMGVDDVMWSLKEWWSIYRHIKGCRVTNGVWWWKESNWLWRCRSIIIIWSLVLDMHFNDNE